MPFMLHSESLSKPSGEAICDPNFRFSVLHLFILFPASLTWSTSTMSGPRVICRVQAMYPYQSGDSSALSFGKGDIIEVLTQLESGWWDGWYVMETNLIFLNYFLGNSDPLLSFTLVPHLDNEPFSQSWSRLY